MFWPFIFLLSPGNRMILLRGTYSIILATTPAPTVLPPSRMANRRPPSHAILVMSSTSTLMLSPGITISMPAGSCITPHKKFKGEIYILKKEEGGRHTPFFKGYRPQFYFRTTDVTGLVTLPEGAEMVMPGDNVSLEIELITPIACEEGLRFAIREGGKTVGAGVVTKILE